METEYSENVTALHLVKYERSLKDALMYMTVGRIQKTHKYLSLDYN